MQLKNNPHHITIYHLSFIKNHRTKKKTKQFEKELMAGEKLRNTCDRFALGALLSVSIFSKSASNSVWQRLRSFSRLVWFKKEKMGKNVLV